MVLLAFHPADLAAIAAIALVWAATQAWRWRRRRRRGSDLS